jgi:catechol 2,3-dioxygenase-like lactoylglutathione lyase family enzyme
MQITSVSAPVRNARAAAEFYGDALGLDIAREPGAVVVTVGSTRLELVEDATSRGEVHLAITIPSNKFDAAKAWIRRRAELLATPDADEFECSPEWNAHSLYFSGPDRSVLELIIRRDLDNATPGPFSTADLLCISEVGVAVPELPALVATLGRDAGVAPYGDAWVDAFAPVGSVDGMLILVAPGRPWFPTADRTAETGPISITATGGQPGTYALGARGSLRILSQPGASQ